MPSAVRAVFNPMNISGPGKPLLQTEVNCLTRAYGWYSPWHFHSADFRPRPPNVSDTGCGPIGIATYSYTSIYHRLQCYDYYHI
jgi:hypothetical protein